MKIGKTLLLVGAVAAGAYAVTRFIGREKVSDVANVAVGKATELLNTLLTKYDEATQGAYGDEDEKEDPWRSATTFNGNDARDDDNEEARR